MCKLIRVLAAVAALGISSIGHTAVIDFDTPVIIDVDNPSGLARYSEDGFSITGQAASFLTIDGLGTGMSPALVLLAGNTISLTGDNGELFSFMGLDAGGLDSSMAAMLNVTGLFGNLTKFSSTLTLNELGSFNFAGLGLSELRFSASADVVLDNLMLDAAAVPEPATTAMLLLGAAALIGSRRRAGTKVARNS